MYVRMHKEGKNRVSAEYRLIDTRLFLIRNACFFYFFLRQ